MSANAANSLNTQTTQQDPNMEENERTRKLRKRLNLYNTLMGQGKEKLCTQTQLQSLISLNYSLYTFLHLNDSDWVLAMIDIDGYNEMINKWGQNTMRKVIQVGTVIKAFCDNDTNKLKGFRCSNLIANNEDNPDGGRHDGFAVLMYCTPNLDKSEKYVGKLEKKIKQQTNETVTVGIAKMNEWETFEEWKQRGLKNIIIARNSENIDINQFSETDEKKLPNGEATTTTTTATTSTASGRRIETENGTIYSDINVKYVNGKYGGNNGNEDEKKEDVSGFGRKLGNKEEFDIKMQEIANNEDYEWVVALMEIDDFTSFVFLNNSNKEIILAEKNKIDKEIFHLFNVYGNGNGNGNGNGTNKNDSIYFGYKWRGNEGGDTFGLILYNSKDRNKCLVSAIDLIESLKDEIRQECSFTVSIGCSKLEESDLGIADDWYERIKKHLEKGKKKGGNRVVYRRDKSDTNRESNINNRSSTSDVLQFESKSNETAQENEIEKKTIESIEVCLCVSASLPVCWSVCLSVVLFF